mgnify:CR=1 FL=1
MNNYYNFLIIFYECVFFYFILLSGPAVEYNGQTCQGLPRAPPLLGQHTHEILTNLLEYSNKEISTLEHDGIIECHLQK